MGVAQATRPSHFKNLWRVAGWPDEYEHATKLCTSLGYERDEDGADLVRVEFVGVGGEPSGQCALIHPHMLFPA